MRLSRAVLLTGVLLALTLPAGPWGGVTHAPLPARADHVSTDLATAPHRAERASSLTGPPAMFPTGSSSLPTSRWIPLPSYIWMVQLQFYNTSGLPYTPSDFDRIAANGYNAVELIVPWSLETAKGVYDFSQLDAYMGYAENDSLAVVVVFWYWGWTFGVANWVPSWISARELYSNGATAAYPPWWDPGARSDYFAFVNATVTHLDPDPDFQGVYAPFGWLDYPFSPPPSGATGAVVAGYSAATTAAYDWYLESQYPSLAAYDTAFGTSYTAWSQIPASLPGSPGWNDFGNFRIFSVHQTFAQLSQYVRAITNRTLFYYYGGDIAGAVVGVNLEDFLFQLAAQYRGIVNVDDADWSEMVSTFGSLASRYHVPFIQEFTPPASGYQGGLEETMANMYIGRPWEVGADFFTYNPTDPNLSWAFPFFGSLRQVTQATAPSQTPRNGVAALVSYFSGFYAYANNGLATSSLSSQQGVLWQLAYTHRPFEEVTDLELMAGAVNLTAFTTVLDLGDAYGDAAHAPYIQGDLQWFVGHGGNLVTSANSVTFLNGQPALEQLSLSPAPATDGVELQGTSLPGSSEIYLAACDWDITTNTGVAESGTLGLVLSTWGLPSSGSFFLLNLLAGTSTAVTATGGVVTFPWNPTAGELDYFELVPAAPLALAVSSNTTLGEGPLPVALAASPSGGSTQYGPVVWSFGDGTGASGTSVSHTFTSLAGRTYLVNATVTDSSGATATSTLQLVLLPRLAVSLSPSFAWAEVGGPPARFSAVPLGGEGPMNLAWSLNGSQFSGGSGRNVSISPSTPGNWSVEVDATDALGYAASSQAWVQVLPAPTVTISGPSVVELPGAASYLASVSGGEASTVQVRWWLDGGPLPGGSGPSVTIAGTGSLAWAAGTHHLNASASDALGGSASSSVRSIQVLAHVSVVVTPASRNTTVGSTVVLAPQVAGGTSPFHYLWSEISPAARSLGNSTSLTFPPTAAGVYGFEVQVTDELSGVAFANATVVVTASSPPSSPGVPSGGFLSGAGVYAVMLLIVAAVAVVMVAFLVRRRGRSRRGGPPITGGAAPPVAPGGLAWSEEEPVGPAESLPP